MHGHQSCFECFWFSYIIKERLCEHTFITKASRGISYSCTTQIVDLVVRFPKRFDVLLGPSLPEVVLALPRVFRSFSRICILVTSEHVWNIVGDPKHHGVRRQDWQLLVILDVRQFQPRRCCLVGPEIETKVETETADLTHDSHSFPERKHV